MAFFYFVYIACIYVIVLSNKNYKHLELYDFMSVLIHQKCSGSEPHVQVH